jgi:hypothetical protein
VNRDRARLVSRLDARDDGRAQPNAALHNDFSASAQDKPTKPLDSEFRMRWYNVYMIPGWHDRVLVAIEPKG